MSMRRVAPAIALFFLSPLVAEFLLGDFTLAQLPFLVALAPAYGGAAVLIRELVRRAGRGWPSIILFALAYGLIEEGLETQSLFNAGYLDAHLLDHGYVPALGIAIPWTLFVLTLHTVWSISVPIALVEEWTDRRTTPWLRAPGLAIVAVLALIGAVFTFAISYADGHFMASPAQLTTVTLIAAGLIVLAFRLPRATPPTPDPAPERTATSPLAAPETGPAESAPDPEREPVPAGHAIPDPSAAPHPAAAAAAGLGSAVSPAAPVAATSVGAVGSARPLGAELTGAAGSAVDVDAALSAPGSSGAENADVAAPDAVDVPASGRGVHAAAPAPGVVLVSALAGGALFLVGEWLPGWLGVPLLLAVLAGMTVLVLRWSRRTGWDGRHRLAVAGGGLLTYAWHEFLMHPVIDASPALVVVSHVVFGAGAVLLLVLEARRVRRRYGPPSAR